MNRFRLMGCLLGFALASVATGAQAQTYDPGYDPQNRYQDDYDDFDRRDERYEERGGQRRVVRCESNDRRTHYCEIDPRGGVHLQHQLSDARCVRGDTWG